MLFFEIYARCCGTARRAIGVSFVLFFTATLAACGGGGGSGGGGTPVASSPPAPPTTPQLAPAKPRQQQSLAQPVATPAAPRAFALNQGEIARNVPIPCDPLGASGKCFYDKGGKLTGRNPGEGFALPGGTQLIFQADSNAAPKLLECPQPKGGTPRTCRFGANGQGQGFVWQTPKVATPVAFAETKSKKVGDAGFEAVPAVAANSVVETALKDDSDDSNSMLHFNRALFAHRQGTTGKAVASDDPAKRRAAVALAVYDNNLVPHPDLPNARWLPTPNCDSPQTASPGDGCLAAAPEHRRDEPGFSHGVAVAGIVAAADNGKHALGVAPDAELLLIEARHFAPSTQFVYALPRVLTHPSLSPILPALYSNCILVDGCSPNPPNPDPAYLASKEANEKEWKAFARYAADVDAGFLTPKSFAFLERMLAQDSAALWLARSLLETTPSDLARKKSRFQGKALRHEINKLLRSDQDGWDVRAEQLAAILLDDKGSERVDDDTPRIENLAAINFSVAPLSWFAILQNRLKFLCTQSNRGTPRSLKFVFDEADKGVVCIPEGFQRSSISARDLALKDFADAYVKQMEDIHRAYSLDLAENRPIAKIQAYRRLYERLGEAGIVSVIAIGNDAFRLAALGVGEEDHENKDAVFGGVSFFAQEEFDAANYMLLTTAATAVRPADAGAPPDINDGISIGTASGGVQIQVNSGEPSALKWELSDYALSCGRAKARCLAAPTDNRRGERESGPPLLAPTTGSSPTPQGIDLKRRYGTSFAAPQVTAAVGLAYSRFKPTMQGYNGIKAAQRILDTTTGLDTCKDLSGKECRDQNKLSDLFGHGLLNIEAALKPYKSLGLPLGENLVAQNQYAPLDGHGARFAPLFAPAAERLALAARRAIAIDELDHAFAGYLRPRIAVVPPEPLGASFFAPEYAPRFGFDVPSARARLTFTRGVRADAFRREERRLFAFARGGGRTYERLFEDASELSLSFARGEGRAEGARNWHFSFSHSELAPRAGGLGRGHADSAARKKSLVRLALSEPLGESARLGLELARLEENGEALGGTTTGLLGEVRSTASHFFTFSAENAFKGGWSAFGEITGARVRARARGGYLRGWDAATAQGWAFGLRQVRVRKGVRLRRGFAVSQPLRAESGAVEFSLPVAVAADGVGLVYDTERVSLAAEARELRFEFVSEVRLQSGASLEARLLHRLHPNHDARARPQSGIAFGVRLPF